MDLCALLNDRENVSRVLVHLTAVLGVPLPVVAMLGESTCTVVFDARDILVLAENKLAVPASLVRGTSIQQRCIFREELLFQALDMMHVNDAVVCSQFCCSRITLGPSLYIPERVQQVYLRFYDKHYRGSNDIHYRLAELIQLGCVSINTFVQRVYAFILSYTNVYTDIDLILNTLVQPFECEVASAFEVAFVEQCGLSNVHVVLLEKDVHVLPTIHTKFSFVLCDKQLYTLKSKDLLLVMLRLIFSKGMKAEMPAHIQALSKTFSWLL